MDYCPGWSENTTLLASVVDHHTEEEAMQSAIEQTGEMRRRGAASPVRLIRVILRKSGTKLTDAPELYRASYFDLAQNLTNAEVYAARVHRWHTLADRLNASHARHGSNWRFGYKDWTDAWGPRPTVCPACGTVVDPQGKC